MVFPFPEVRKLTASSLQNIDNVQSMVVSSSTLGKILNLSERRIRQLAEVGVVEKVKRGQYKLIDNIQRYIMYIKTNDEASDIESDNKLDLDREKALYERVKRKQAELKLAAMKGTMHESKDVERVMSDMLANFRSKVLGIASKVAPMLVARDNITEIQNLIQKECFEALSELSEYNPADFYSEDYIDLDDDVEIDEGELIGEEKAENKE